MNNAGITGLHDVFLCDYPFTVWQEVIETDPGGVFLGIKYGIPAILKNGGRAVVNLSAVNGLVGIAGLTPYTAVKHGIIGLTRSAALEYADKEVRINTVCLGYVSTYSLENLPSDIYQ